ncbi:MAG: helix-turn-helix transcriptional regulator [Gaiellaceae bacterium]
MAAIERAVARGRLRAQRLRIDSGREIHVARATRGLSQAAVAAAAGISQAQLSLIERGLYPGVQIETLACLCAVVGLELSIKTYPGGHRCATARTWSSSSASVGRWERRGRGRQRFPYPSPETNEPGIDFLRVPGSPSV